MVKHTYQPGLEKLINANQSVSKVNDRLFPVELSEIGENFGAHTFIMLCPIK